MASEPTKVSTADQQKALAEKGTEFIMGMDVPRVWANGAQLFLNPQVALLVFREQNLATAEEGVELLLKNVASVVLPLDVAREMHRLLGEQLSVLDATQH